VLAFRQGDHGFGLAVAEVLVVIVGRNRRVHLSHRQRGIDQQMVVAGVRLFYAGWTNTHPGWPELQ
jgi:hypothetical protein